MRRIKNRGELTKEGLIISLLKPESSDAERNYMKHLVIILMMMILMMIK